MKILAADTTTAINTVAVCNDEHVLAETVVACGRSHTERLLSTVQWVLAEVGLKLAEIDALAITVGPGSFTGLRVGVATWKGLALACGRPLAPVPTLDAMTRLGLFADGQVCPLLDARMGEVFGAVYEFRGWVRARRTEDRVCPVEGLLDALDEGPAFFLGDGAALYHDRIVARRPDAVFVSPPCSVPRASCVAAEALALLRQGVSTDLAAVAPVYLRPSQAEQNRARRKAEAR